MIQSKYNIIYKDQEKVIVFNTLTSALVKLDVSCWEVIEEGKYESIADNTLHNLIEMGIIAEESNMQLYQYKYKFYKSAFEKRTPFLYIAPTMNCNFNCFYCFEQGNKHPGIMTEQTASKIVKFLKAHNKKKVSIVWFGGEPMLGFKRILYICNQLKINEIEYSSSMITNGSLFNDKNVSQLPLLNIKFIQISMDGVGSTHDNRRHFAGGKPTFSIIVNNIRRILSATAIPIVIQITMDKNNPYAYEEMVEYCNSNFKEYVNKGQLQIGAANVQNRTGFDKDNNCFSAEELVSKEIERMRCDDHSNYGLPTSAMPCMYRTAWQLAIDSEGYLYKCIEQLGNPKDSIGSLEQDKLSLRLLSISSFNEDSFSDPECVDCGIFPICGGGCPLDRIKRAKGESRDICSKYKGRLAGMLPVIYEKSKIKQNP